MKWITIAIGAVVAVSVIPTIVTSITALTGTDGALEGTVAGTLLDLAPLVFVASILGFMFLRTGQKQY